MACVDLSGANRLDPLTHDEIAPMNSRIPASILFFYAIAHCGWVSAGPSDDNARRIPVKVMIVTMFAPEASTWLKHFQDPVRITVPGLAADYPAVTCRKDGVCLMTTGMGHTNAAASMMAVLFSPKFDLRDTYFLVTGIAGIDPKQGTLGTTAWAKYLVDFGTQWEIDAREIPKTWSTGFLGINTTSPDQMPKLDYQTEVFVLNPRLVDAAFDLTHDVHLQDSSAIAAYRIKYPYAPANQPPRVTQCDTLAADTWWEGDLIGQRARDWTKMLTHGKGVYCTSQQEDNATFAAIKRADAAGLARKDRVLVLRAGSDFDRQPPGVTAAENLLDYQKQGGFVPALENLYRTGAPVVQAIVAHWSLWKKGVPAALKKAS